MGREKITAVIICSLFLLSATEVFALEVGGVAWEEYVAKEWKITFYVPENMKLREKEKGEWGILSGVTPDGDVELVAQAVDEKYALDDIEDYAEKELGISRKRFKKVDSGLAHHLKYRTYVAKGKIAGVDSGLAVIVAQHESEEISYLLYLYATADVFDEYRKAFKFWYENVYGLE